MHVPFHKGDYITNFNTTFGRQELILTIYEAHWIMKQFKEVIQHGILRGPNKEINKHVKPDNIFSYEMQPKFDWDSFSLRYNSRYLIQHETGGNASNYRYTVMWS